MNYSAAIILIDKSVRLVSVSYDAGNAPAGKPGTTLPFAAFKTKDATLKKGDLVVVPTETRHGFTVGKVEEVDISPDFDTPAPHNAAYGTPNSFYGWIAGRVDKDEYDRVVKVEEDAIDTIRKADADAKRDEMAARLAKSSPGLAALMNAPQPPPIDQ